MSEPSPYPRVSAARRRSLARNRGFSLIELAVVLVIIGLLVGGGIAALDATTEQTRRSEQRRQFEVVQSALYGFAMSHGRLPCPDTTYPPDGRADPADPSGSCNDDEGALPWVDLGVDRRDAWGFPLLYHVDGDFADAVTGGAPASFEIGDQGNLNVFSAQSEVGGSADIAGNAVAMVVSYGPQGGQVWTEGGSDIACPGTAAGFSADESENCDSDNSFVDAGYRPPDVDNGFDDMLLWIPYPVLSARMVEARVLP